MLAYDTSSVFTADPPACSRSDSTEPLWTFTIVTTDASQEFSWLHDRQPVILPDEAALETWLDTSSGKWTAELSKLCAPYHAADHPLVWYVTTTFVRSDMVYEV